MKTIENDINKAINSLFISLPEPESFKSYKDLLFGLNKNILFYFDNKGEFNNKINTRLEFKDSTFLTNFLKQEKSLAVKFQEFEKAAEINELIESYGGQKDIDYFNLYYQVKIINDNEVIITFKTNSLILRYELIGN